jgi:indolepyruvate ferredoxin oxidoreductase beta subunit
MAQRGGSIASHVRIGSGAYSPTIRMGQADSILAFELCEAIRALPYLKQGGAMAACDAAIQPAGAMRGYDRREMADCLKRAAENIFLLDSALVIENCGPRCLNVALLGAAASLKAIPFSAEDLEKTLLEKFSGKAAEMNVKALRFGAALPGSMN